VIVPRIHIDEDDMSALAVLVGVAALLVGAWLIAPALAAVALGLALITFGLRRTR
jgi:hypothetical protein